MRTFRAVVLAFVAAAAIGCGSGGSLFRQYEYQEDVYLSLDATATVDVRTSLAAPDALRGPSVDAGPRRRIDRDAIRRFYTHAGHASDGDQRIAAERPAIRPRLEVDNIRRLGEAPPFAWSARPSPQTRSRPAVEDWRGGQQVSRRLAGRARELVAFASICRARSIITTPAPPTETGQHPSLEQPLADRLDSIPLVLDARMQTSRFSTAR